MGESRDSQVKLLQKRSPSSSCSSEQDDGIGNLGFNSFNFLTFMILTFNAITNVNNNINNNNNNNNDVSLNSISQSSSNTISNSDNSNDIMVMILPMPGKRRKRKRSLPGDGDDEPWISMSDEAFGSLMQTKMNHLRNIDEECEAYTICLFLRMFRAKMELDDIFWSILYIHRNILRFCPCIDVKICFQAVNQIFNNLQKSTQSSTTQYHNEHGTS